MSASGKQKTVESRELVIDASLCRSAGHVDSPSELSCNACELLNTVYSVCHKAIVIPKIEAEYFDEKPKNKPSKFLWEWYTRMRLKGKLITDHQDNTKIVLHWINATAKVVGKTAMAEDAHLIGAALHDNHPIISLDEEVHLLFAALLKKNSSLPRLKRIIWVNPSFNWSETINWLKSGAPDESIYFLKNYSI